LPPVAVLAQGFFEGRNLVNLGPGTRGRQFAMSYVIFAAMQVFDWTYCIGISIVQKFLCTQQKKLFLRQLQSTLMPDNLKVKRVHATHFAHRCYHSERQSCCVLPVLLIGYCGVMLRQAVSSELNLRTAKHDHWSGSGKTRLIAILGMMSLNQYQTLWVLVIMDRCGLAQHARQEPDRTLVRLADAGRFQVKRRETWIVSVLPVLEMEDGTERHGRSSRETSAARFRGFRIHRRRCRELHCCSGVVAAKEKAIAKVLELWSLTKKHLKTIGLRSTGCSWLATPAPQQTDIGAFVSQERLRRLMSPFLMRRLKSEVAQDLPQNVDQEQECELGNDLGA